MDRLKSNEYLEELRDRIAADLYTNRISEGLSGSAYEQYLIEAERLGLTVEDFTAVRSIDLANGFITMLRKEKMEESKQ